MSSRTQGRRTVTAPAGVIIAALLATAACSSHPASPAPARSAATSKATTSSRTGPVTSGRTTVTLPGDTTHHLTVTDTPLAGTPRTEAASLASQLGLAAGQPVEITSSGPVCPNGVTITRTYDHPLPAGAAATLAYFDPQFQTWSAVPSTLSPDRRTLTATVHHLSIWDDFVSGTQATMKAVGDGATKAADWGYYEVGKVFDTRIDTPTCTNPRPTWVKDALFIAADRNNPILFCTGRDPKHPDVLVVKAGVNRGFGYRWTAATKPAWVWNSGQQPDTAAAIDQALSGLDKIFAESGRAIAQDSSLVGAGKEVDLGFNEASVRSAGDPLVQLVPQNVLGFLIGTLGSLVGTDVSAMADGPVIAAIALAGCANDLRSVKDAGSATKAVLSCVSTIDEDVARQLSTYLLKRGMANPGQLAGKLVARAGMYLALVGPVFSGMNYWAARAQDKAAGAINIALAPKPAPATPIRIGTYGRHDFKIDLRPNHTGLVSVFGCDVPDGGCAQYGEGTWQVVGTKVRFTVKSAYYWDGSGDQKHHPFPDSWWTTYGERSWGNTGDYLDLWKSPTPGTVFNAEAYAGALEYTTAEPGPLCDYQTPAGRAAQDSGICGA